jgi:hypothetical protein
VPICWHFTEQGLVPGEFEYLDEDKEVVPALDVSRDAAFIEDLYSVLKKRGVLGYYGIGSVVGARGEPAAVEITRGRTNIAYPFALSEDAGRNQVTWRFKEVEEDREEDGMVCSGYCVDLDHELGGKE